MRKFIGPLFLLACSAAHASLESLNPLSWFVPKDASNYATKMAATIQDKPECQKFKVQIMVHGKGSPTHAKTLHDIEKVREEAKSVGCHK